MDSNNLKYYLLLQSIEGIGPVTFQKLLEVYKNPKAVFETTYDDLEKIPRLNQRIINEILRARDKVDEMEKILQQLYNRNIKVITKHDKLYPIVLNKISNAPSLLYLSHYLPQGKTFGIIGTRDASQYGKEQAYMFASELARNGFIIVSGYAKGIDTAAHHGAVDNNQLTIAVLPTGILKFRLHEELNQSADKFSSHAILLSEFFPLSEWSLANALLRNRITAILSDYLLVIEAADSGGTLSTVEYAVQYNKKVFILKGINSIMSEKIISLGAVTINNISDLLNQLDR